MCAFVLTIGDELLYGQRQDTNSHYLAASLHLLGIEVVGLLSVGDSTKAIKQGLAVARHQASCVVITGGLGPTLDDNTRPALAAYLQRPLGKNEEAKALVKAYGLRRGKEYPACLYLLPKGSLALPNPAGLAPGLWVEDKKNIFVCLPGVPAEAKAMFEQVLVPRFRSHTLLGAEIGAREHRWCHTAGVPESVLSKRLASAQQQLDKEGIALAYLPRLGAVSLRLTAPKSCVGALTRAHARLLRQLQPVVYHTDPDASFVRVLIDKLIHLKTSLAVAESCTGGQLAATFVKEKEASRYFLGGIIAYEDKQKVKQLDLPKAWIAKHGVVSAAVAEAMAKGVQKRFNAQLGLATTGWAGPATASQAPQDVGLAYIACAYEDKVYSVQHRFAGDRASNIAHTVAYALVLLWTTLVENINTSAPNE